MIPTNDLRPGMVIDFEGELHEVVEYMHVKPGKGPAFVKTKLKNLRTGAGFDKKFNTGDRVESVRLEEKQMEYLYRDGGDFVFMDSATYEQIHVPEGMLEGKSDLLKENGQVNIQFHGELILGIKLPNFIELAITYTEPGAKGDTVGLTLKPATLETGAVVQVPIFVQTGAVVKIDTRTRGYIERVKT